MIPHPPHPPNLILFFLTTSSSALPETSISPDSYSPHPPHLPYLILFFLTIVLSVFPSLMFFTIVFDLSYDSIFHYFFLKIKKIVLYWEKPNTYNKYWVNPILTSIVNTIQYPIRIARPCLYLNNLYLNILHLKRTHLLDISWPCFFL